MSISVLTGLPGSGKSTRLIELVNQAIAQDRPVVTFASNSSPWLMARDHLRVNRIIGCRRPGLTCPLHQLVSPDECADILRRTPPGALVAFEEGHYFGLSVVPHWINASKRDLEVLVAMPSQGQLKLLEGQDYTETKLVMNCQQCSEAEATTFIIVPGKDATLSICAKCEATMQDEARWEILERLERQPPYPDEKAIYQPIEFEECADWRLVRPDSSRRVEVMLRVLNEFGLPGEGPPGHATYLDVGCNTGYFCHHMRRLGFFAEGVDVMDGDVTVARLLDSFFRRDNNNYVHANCYDYLRDTQDRKFDVTSAFAVFQWLMIQQSVDHGIQCLGWLFAKTKRVCFLEMGYSAEPQYRDKIGINIDREWVLNIMQDLGGFSGIRVFDAGQHGLIRDLFVGLKAPEITVGGVPEVKRRDESRST